MKLIALKKEKGQAFSTFQLLIAAVVALALLGVLMPIIGGINPAGGSITDSVKEKIKSQQDLPGSLTLTESVRVSSRNQETIATDSITEGSGLSPENVIFIVPTLYEADFGVSINNNILQIKRSERVNYRFGILCHRSVNALTEFVDELNSTTGSLFSSARLNITGTDVKFDPSIDANSRVCIVFPVKE